MLLKVALNDITITLMKQIEQHNIHETILIPNKKSKFFILSIEFQISLYTKVSGSTAKLHDSNSVYSLH